MPQKLMWRILTNDRAAAMAEYGLLVVLIAIVALLAVRLAGSEVSETFSEIASAISD